MKKHNIILGVIIVAVAALAVAAVYKYQATPEGLTVAQAVHQRDSALLDLRIEKALITNDQQAITNLKADNATLTSQKATICTQLKTTKLVQPLCQ